MSKQGSNRQGTLIVGAGLMGGWHYYYARELGIRVLAIVDPIEEKAKNLSRKNPACKVYSSLEIALAELRPSSIHLCTGLADRRKIMPVALLAGADLLIEKPVAGSLKEFQEWRGEAQKAGIALIPCHQFVWQRGFCHALDERPRLGRVLRLEHRVHTAGGQQLARESRTRLPLDILPHSLSLFQRWIGPDISSVEWSVCRLHDYLSISGQHEETQIKAEVCLSSRPTKNEIVIIGTEGTFCIDLFLGFAVYNAGTVSRWHKATLPLSHALKTGVEATKQLLTRALYREPAYPGLKALMKSFYNSSPQELQRAMTDARDICAAMDILEHKFWGADSNSVTGKTQYE